jgi:hypothetical protein
MRRTRIRIAIGLTTLLGSLAIGLTVNALAASGEDRSMTAVAAQATARFHDLDAAKDAGWNVLVVDKAGLTCIDNQPVGGMGVHWARALRAPIRPHPGPRPLRAPGLLVAARVDLAAERGRHVRAVEPGGSLLRNRR